MPSVAGQRAISVSRGVSVTRTLRAITASTARRGDADAERAQALNRSHGYGEGFYLRQEPGGTGTGEIRSGGESAGRASAALAARLAGRASRALGRGGGTALPGLIAERLAPNLLSHLAAQVPGGIAVVTGTNGKTTTSHMLAAILSRAGRRPLRNASGSNLSRGVAGALAMRADARGRLRLSPPGEPGPPGAAWWASSRRMRRPSPASSPPCARTWWW